MPGRAPRSVPVHGRVRGVPCGACEIPTRNATGCQCWSALGMKAVRRLDRAVPAIHEEAELVVEQRVIFFPSRPTRSQAKPSTTCN